jgi:hypothetical protein
MRLVYSKVEPRHYYLNQPIEIIAYRAMFRKKEKQGTEGKKGVRQIRRTQRIKCPFEILIFSAQLSSYGPIQMSKFMKCRDSWVLIFLKAPY